MSSSTALVNGNQYYASQTVSGCESPRTEVTVTINALPSATLSTSNSTQTIVLGNAIGDINYTLSNVTSASATGLPTGVTGSLAGNTYTISGAPTQVGTFNYSISFTANCGTVAKLTGKIQVNSYLVEYANIQSPKKPQTILLGEQFDVYAQVKITGITDAPGQGSGVSAWLGYSLTNTNPNTWTHWTAISYNPNYDTSPSYQIANDEYYYIDFVNNENLEGGTYYYASRFQRNGSSVYTYGGTDEVNTNSSGGIWGTTNANGKVNVSGVVKVVDEVIWDGTQWKWFDDDEGTSGAWKTIVEPNQKLKAKIEGNYPASAPSFTCKKLTIDNGVSVTIGAGKYIRVINEIVNNNASASQFTVESDGGLIQVNDASVNTGNITVKRNAIMKRLDYNYWGSPVLGQNLRSFSSGTLYTRFYVYNESNDYFDGIFAKNLYPDGTQSLTPLENSATYNYVPGKGYAVRAPNNYTTSVATFNGAFVGVPNNGEITFNLQHTKQGFNLVSNPYPSNIDFDALYSANQTKIYQTAYFWTNVNPNPIMQGSNYPSQYKGVDYYNNYAVYNGSGGVAATSTGAAGVGSATPNNFIKIGQGFIIKAKPAGNNQPLIFKNNIRTEDTTGIFFNSKIANSKPDRFWLTLSTPLGVNNDLLIAYKENATNDFELDYDAPLLTSPPDSFYSVLGDQKLMIQGRKYPLVIDDKVILGQRFYQDGIYKIAIKAKEGIFASGQNIYLKDKLNGTFTNLQTTDYTFNATQGESTDRFEIVYQPEGALGTSENIKYGLRVYQSGEYYVIEADKAFKEVKVYDASGRLLNTIKSGKKQLMIEKNKLVDGFNLFSIIFADDIVNKKVISK